MYMQYVFMYSKQIKYAQPIQILRSCVRNQAAYTSLCFMYLHIYYILDKCGVSYEFTRYTFLIPTSKRLIHYS